MDPLFQVHLLNENGIKKATVLAEAFDSLITTLKGICPESTREFSLVKTKLEEASFFAKKSIANLPENQKAE
jgi:hypothetical protein